MRVKPLIGSPWLPVVSTTISSILIAIQIANFDDTHPAGIFNSPISIASLVTLTMLLPTKQIFRPNSMQLSTTC